MSNMNTVHRLVRIQLDNFLEVFQAYGDMMPLWLNCLKTVVREVVDGHAPVSLI